MTKLSLLLVQELRQTEMSLDAPVVIEASARSIYRLRDEFGAQPQRLALWRRGEDLVAEIGRAHV